MSNSVVKLISVLRKEYDGETLELDKFSCKNGVSKWNLCRWEYGDDCQKDSKKDLVLSDELKQALEKIDDLLEGVKHGISTNTL